MKRFSGMVPWVLSVVLFLAWSFVSSPVAVGAAGAGQPKLTAKDCKKCHLAEDKAIFEDGDRHRTEVSCLDCHREHLPKGTDTIPACSDCHKQEDQPHFAIEAPCLSCHQDPHRPLTVTFGEAIENKPVCLGCHPYQGEEMEQFPSAHAERDCSMCHLVHGTFENCLQCHEVHVEGMEYRTCLRCHKPHRPTDIVWQSDIPSDYCGGCHPDKVEQQKNNKNKHGGFICVFCHRFGHSPDLQPECHTCHGPAHDRSITEASPVCLNCHRDAHNLLL